LGRRVNAEAIVKVPTSNAAVWRQPSPGTYWRIWPLTDDVRQWLNQHAGITGWLELEEYYDVASTRASAKHIASDIMFYDRNVALLFKLTWGGA
jgi:hypothetical protein